MYLKLNRRTAACNGLLTSGFSALMAGSVFLLASVAGLQSYNHQNEVTVDLKPWSWLSQLRIGADQVTDDERTLLGLAQVSMPENAAPLFVEKVSRPKILPLRISRRLAQSLVKVTTQKDLVKQTAAAPTFTPVVVTVSGMASADDLKSFQVMHRQLHLQFLASLRGDAPVITQMATQPEVTVAKFQMPQPKKAPAKRTHVRLHAKVAAPVKVSKPEVAYHLEASTSAHLLVALKDRTGEKASASIAGLTTVDSLEKYTSYDAFREQTESTYQQISKMSEKLFGAEEVITYAAAAPAPQPAATPSVQVQGVSGGVMMTVSNAPGYSDRVDYSMPTLNAIRTAMNTQHDAMANGYSNESPTPVVTLPPAVVEAFEWKSPVADVLTENLSLDGWKKLRAAAHWPTVYWNPDTQTQGAMISNNTAVFLAKLAERNIEPDTGIVFGKIPAGWNVEFSDRSESVIYRDMNNQLVTSPEHVRYFAFLNAAPGSRIVSLKAPLSAETAAVAIPVLNGSATYLDLSAVSKRGFSGFVLNADAAQTERKPMSGATVTVLGQPAAYFQTTESGAFQIPQMFAIGSYPLFVDTTVPNGVTHRYRVTPDKLENVDLFRMSDAQINVLVGQLEGGVSPESGMIVAAMSGLTQTAGDGRLFPKVQPLFGNATLTPETYAISRKGQLDVGQPLEQGASSFISVQVPEGPVAAQVEDNNRTLVWSQLVFAQPRVINIIAPN